MAHRIHSFQVIHHYLKSTGELFQCLPQVNKSASIFLGLLLENHLKTVFRIQKSK